MEEAEEEMPELVVAPESETGEDSSSNMITEEDSEEDDQDYMMTQPTSVV